MPSFSERFIKSKGQPIEHEGKALILADKFPIFNGDKIKIIIESTNSDAKQGISVDITGKCHYMGKEFQQGKGIEMIFWEDTSPKEMELTIFAKKDFIWIQNIWENATLPGSNIPDSGRYGAAMIVEKIKNGRRYCCNDWHPDNNFDDIIFTVQNLGNIADKKKNSSNAS